MNLICSSHIMNPIKMSLYNLVSSYKCEVLNCDLVQETKVSFVVSMSLLDVRV